MKDEEARLIAAMESFRMADKKSSKLTAKLTACSLPSAGDRSNIILGVPRLNHKEQGKFKDNIIK